MPRIIVMGGIGSGKSTVSQLLTHHGYLVVEADRLGHAVLEPDGEAFDAVSQRWPEVVVDGRIDRSRLAGVVFGDLAQLRQLEALTHPHIRRRINSATSGLDPVAVELPLLPEFLGPGWVSVFVDADDDIRRQRLLDRGMSENAIAARMGAQPNRSTWLEVADHVIRNSGSLEHLAEQVSGLVVTLTS